ncbi:type IX secretion system protein PorQ [Dyadobacter sp. CY312]|uniref:type IX secretion system protein PorQ n=1 Tax=Dyadobacter sp. CY312 TaxID=2907303 RepID=UPI001F2FD23B|nr:type IX secretion system protein PorQ [Dyadobacter sp. CY312]MCE7044383.1 type IX secretion system protein PorQ [Dyadobacter sp. CY312]
MSRAGLRFSILPILLLLMKVPAIAQPTGGRSKLDFLQLPSQAKSNALGSSHFTILGHDPALFLQNPALLDSSVSDNVSLNLMPYLADTRFVNVAYAKTLKRTGGTWATGIQYLNYGTMQETDDIGNVVGEFRAADYGISAGYGHTIGAFTLGATAKLVASSIESYTTWGMAMDWGGLFKHPRQDLTVGFLVKNLGFLKQNYNSASDPILPLDVRVGISLKPQYMPIRFTATIHHLNKFDMVYNDPNLFFTYDNNGGRIPRKVGVAEKLGRHLALGAEALLHPNFRILLGYDHLRRQELRLVDRGALAGFSFGAWLRVRKFEIGYGRAQYTPGFGSSSLSIVMNLKKGFARERVNFQE